MDELPLWRMDAYDLACHILNSYVAETRSSVTPEAMLILNPEVLMVSICCIYSTDWRNNTDYLIVWYGFVTKWKMAKNRVT